MTDRQWNDLKAVVEGEVLSPFPVGFIIDSPWLPSWSGISILDYFTSERLWLEANLKAARTFPGIMFLPGFWSEFGMCSEPVAFGARSSFPENEFPHAHPTISDPSELNALPAPDPEKEGLGPMILHRLRLLQDEIEKEGHRIRFSVSRGPLNIASYLMGTTELMMALMTHPAETHRMLRKITDYLLGLHARYRQLFPSIDGILVLDDIIGFISGSQFEEFGLPYFRELFECPCSVRFLHNDALCRESAAFLPEMNVNLFNMGVDTDLNQLKELTGNRVTLMGNIPPRDVMAGGTPDEVAAAVSRLKASLNDPSRIILSCGGGMPPGAPTENIQAFLEAASS